MIAIRDNFTSDNIPFIADATFPRVRTPLVTRRTDNQNVLIIADSPFHKLGKLIARRSVPLVKDDIDTVAAQASAEFTNPCSMRIIVP
jgi:hypothetical protein